MDACKNCQSSNITYNCKIGLSADVGSVGPAFKKGFFRGNEPLVCDICIDCGEIVRFYIKNTERDFIASN